MTMTPEVSNPFFDSGFGFEFASDSDLRRYVFPITDSTPASLLAFTDEESVDAMRTMVRDHIRQHRIQSVVKRFEQLFCDRPVSPAALAIVLKTVRHYHNGLRGGLLHLAGRITEDKRLHRSTRDRVCAAGPLFAAFDEFTDNPRYVISVVTPLLRAVLAETKSAMSADDAIDLLSNKGLLRRDEPHLERFYGVVDELYVAGTLAASSEEMDQETPEAALPAKAIAAYQARHLLTKRPDLSPAGACAFMFGNETVAGLFYGKLYKGFRKFQNEYAMSDHACNYFGDHASEDGDADAPAFEASHAALMLEAVLRYGSLGKQHREQAFRGIHLFLETYASLVESLCEVIEDDRAGGAGARQVLP
jgi:hypothetical protein